MTATATNNASSYTSGQCTWGVARLAPWVPAGWGDARQWLASAQAAHYPTGSAPSLGSVAVWEPGKGGAKDAGHVALVTGFQGNGLPIVTEMNWNGSNKYDTRALTASQAAAVAGYILPKGATPQGGTPILTGDTSGSTTGTQWYDNIPVVGGVLATGQFLGFLLDKLTDPATYLTVLWLGAATAAIFIGIHKLTGMGDGAVKVIKQVTPAAVL